jgi:hypothetical protein
VVSDRGPTVHTTNRQAAVAAERVGIVPGTEIAAAARPRHAHIFERDANDHYVEPYWVSARLFDVESFGAPGARILDPACGWGRILKSAQDAGYTPIGCDVVDRRDDPHAFAEAAFHKCNFLKASPVRSTWSIICNPPFDHIEEFCERANSIAIYKAAILMPLRRIPAAHWLCRLPLETVWLLTPRPSMPPAAWLAAGNKASGGTPDFAWLVFNKRDASGGSEPRVRWLHRDRVRP